MLVAINVLASEQNKASNATMDKVVWLLNYAATHPDAIMRYQASDMYPRVHSNASFLSEPNARSRHAGYFYLSDLPANPDIAPKAGDPPPMLNGPILVDTHRVKVVVLAFDSCVPVRTWIEKTRMIIQLQRQ